MENVCDDYLAFEDTLRNWRKLDDNIVHALNTTIPTTSFAVKGTDPGAQCQNLHQQLLSAHQDRENAIKKCIVKLSDRVHELRLRRDEADDEDGRLTKDLRKEQNKLRLIQNELHVEEVIRDRTTKIFHERCRLFYRPTN